LLELGALPAHVTVLRNGVDLALFTPREGGPLNLDQPRLLSVGHLIADKGHQFVIEALVELRDARLTIVGDGPMRDELMAFAARLGVADRVTWTGTVSQRELRDHYASADATVLASRLEGMPNVLLESIACGAPVLAPDVGGNAEVISNAAAGVLMRERSASGVVEALRALAQSNPDREGVRCHAEQFGWGPTANGLVDLFEKMITVRAAQTARVSRAEWG
jgi:glycosyltransferase involved in cell wall biosynthesis